MKANRDHPTSENWCIAGCDLSFWTFEKTIQRAWLVQSSVFLLSFQLGIHGYTFAITNNGYILTHPDLRPLVSFNTGCPFNEVSFNLVLVCFFFCFCLFVCFLNNRSINEVTLKIIFFLLRAVKSFFSLFYDVHFIDLTLQLILIDLCQFATACLNCQLWLSGRSHDSRETNCSNWCCMQWVK